MEKLAYYRKISSLNDKMQKRKIIEIKYPKNTFPRRDMLRNETFLNDNLTKCLSLKCKYHKNMFSQKENL